jgi:hypothetical protein
MKLTATLESTGRTTTGFVIPDGTVDALGGGRHPKVTVRIGDVEFRSSIARMDGRFLLGISAERRQATGLSAGDVVDLELSLDTAKRTVEVPADFAAALAAEPAAQAFWVTLSFSKKQWHILQITGAKKAETRSARIARSVSMLREQRAR